MSNPSEQESSDVALVRKHLTALGEHFDSVQIFTSRHEHGEKEGTLRINLGCGNWFARYGQIKEWQLKEEEQTRINVRRDNNEDDN